MTTKNKHEKAMQNGGTLERTFGSTATTRILDFLSLNRDTDYSKQDIARYSDVSMRHTLVTLEKLENIGLIKNTRNVGHSHMYKFNVDNEDAMTLCKWSLKMACNAFEKYALEEETKEKLTQVQKQDKKELLVSVPA